MQDARLRQQSVDSIRGVFAPKVDGALNLLASQHALPLKHNVLFSSLVAFLGNAGQSNYAAANSALNSISDSQRLKGLQSVCVLWGMWALGMAVQNSSVIARSEAGGLPILEPEKGLEALECILQGAPGHSQVISAFFTWERLLAPGVGLALAPMFSDFVPKSIPKGATGLKEGTLPGRLPALPQNRRTDDRAIVAARDVLSEVQRIVGGVLGRNLTPTDQPLMEAGLDSLGAVELQRLLARAFDVQLPATFVFDHPSISAVAKYLAATVASAEVVATPDAMPAEKRMQSAIHPPQRLGQRVSATLEVRRAVHGVLGSLPADDQPLMEAGLDSLGAVELQQRLSEALAISLPTTVVFDYPSIAAIADRISSDAATATHRVPPDQQEPGFLERRSASEHPTRLLSADVLERVRRTVAALIGDLPPDNQPLLDAGMDSLGAVELQRRLSEEFSLSLPATLVFDYPSIAAIKDHIDSAGVENSTDVSSMMLEWRGRGLEAASFAKGTAHTSTSILAPAGRYPQSGTGVPGFWEAVKAEHNIPVLVPLQRWDIDLFYTTDVSSGAGMYVRLGGFVDGLDLFDAEVFRYDGNNLVMPPLKGLAPTAICTICIWASCNKIS
jgi:acyl carrier protein